MNDDTSILGHGDTRVLDADHRAAAQVRDYVSAVRRQLQDLDPEDLDDLTSGMHADLAELLAERGGRLEAILGRAPPPGMPLSCVLRPAYRSARPLSRGHWTWPRSGGVQPSG